MERMSVLDAAFLLTEDEEPGVSLAISSVAVFEGPVLSADEFTGLIADRLPLIPRYRHKVRTVPLDLGAPVWVDDEHFDLAHHLRRTAVPSPGGDRELAALVARVMSHRLERDRPLWQTWLVEGLAGGRWALISVIHHCMADGVSGTALYRALLDETPEPRALRADDWQPAAEPSALALTAGALGRLAVNPLVQAGALAGALRHPVSLAGQVLDTVRGIEALPLLPPTAGSLAGPLSPHRRYAFSRGSVSDVKTVRGAHGGTFNDVVLAAVTAGYRALLLSRGETPRRRAVRTMVPVSVRAPGDEGVQDNRVSLMLADLPVELADPVARLAAVRTRLDALKAGKEAQAVAALTALADQGPFPLFSTAFRRAAGMEQHVVVTVTTTVPGPRRPLYALGRPMVELLPYVPIASSVRTGVSILTYADRIAFGVTGDDDSAPDVEVLARGIEAGLAELVALSAG